MILFLSDMHLGRGTPTDERRQEAELLAFLRAQAPAVSALYLMGDVFDQYIEYRHLVPKGFVRFLALLAEWTDQGIPVTYFAGNHDPWHQDYFTEELGVRVIFDDLLEPLMGRTVYMTHGDGWDGNRRYRYLKPVLRHPVPVALYRGLLPGDTGFRLARWYNRRFGHKAIRWDRVAHLRAHARQMLTVHQAELVVMGHAHHPECTLWPEGTYLNPGSWHLDRTFGRLDAHGPTLLRWHEGALHPVTSPINHPSPH